MKTSTLIALAAVSALTLAGCTAEQGPVANENTETETAPSASPETTTLSVTTTVLGSIVEQMVACVDDPAYQVEVLMPLGVDPHDYQPSSAQLATIAQSGVVIANGLTLEESLVGPLEELEAEGGVVYRLAEMADPLPFAEDDHAEDEHDSHDDHAEEQESHDEHGEEEHAHDEHGEDEHSEEKHSEEKHEEEGADGHDGHDHGEFDPHFWMDMDRVATATELLGTELQATFGGDFESCAVEVAQSIRDAEAEVIDTLSVIAEEDRVLVTDHEVLGYFAERYNFDIAGVLIEGGSTLAEPSSQELAALITEIEARGLTTLFGNYHVPSDLLDSIAAESGDVQVVPLYLGSIGEPESEFGTYQDMMRANARAMASALGS
jgi:zinc/manganese transport system substrate-binding protein